MHRNTRSQRALRDSPLPSSGKQRKRMRPPLRSSPKAAALRMPWDDDSDKSLELPESHSTYLLPRLRYEFDGGLVTRIVFDAGESP